MQVQREIPVSEEMGWRWQRCLVRGEGGRERGGEVAHVRAVYAYVYVSNRSGSLGKCSTCL